MKKYEKITRRDFVIQGSQLAGVSLLLSHASALRAEAQTNTILVNDIHSQLNATPVHAICKPTSVEQLANIVARATNGRALSVAGKRHSMGGQQFGTDTDLVDMTAFNRILSFDRDKGILEAESGATWPQIIDYCWREQPNESRPWAIAQKQTGADSLTLGGSLASNVHGRGLTKRPLIQDIESFKCITPDGGELQCSRSSNPELFRLVIGGYGFFGIVTSIKLRLVPRARLKRAVKIMDVEDLMPGFAERISQGYTYGDFQYMTDPASPAFLKKGVFSCYLPVGGDEPGGEITHRELSVDDWRKLYRLAFTDKSAAYQAYSQYYLSTNDQLYWTDTHQLSVYLEDYRSILDDIGSRDASLMISEVYVPRKDLVQFMASARAAAIKENWDIIYGTVRLIERDGESFLAWAKEDYVCIIFNLKVIHSPDGIAKAQRDFRSLIDAALLYGGSYYLTYHRWARKDQVEKCYPQFSEFLKMKRKYDPNEVIQSDWYRFYKALFGE
jgi:FAD/FMN-containing dehydrogenase